MQKRLKEMKLKPMLLASFGSIIALAAIIVLCSIGSLRSVSKQTTDMFNKPYTANDIMWEVRKEVVSLERMLYKGIATEDESESQAAVDANVTSAQTINEDLDKLLAIFTSENKIKIANDIKNYLSKAGPIRESINELILSNHNSEAYDMIVNEYNTYFDQITADVLELAELVEGDAQGFVENSNNTANLITVVLAVALVIGLIYGIWVAISITKTLLEPIKGLMEGLGALSEGDLDTKFVYESKNEFGELSQRFRMTRQGLKAILQDLNHLLEGLSEYNFDVRSTCADRYVGLFQPLLENFRDTVVKLSDTLQQIKDAAGQVDMGSTQMAESSQSLAQGATDQTASIEELQASIDDVTRQVKENEIGSGEALEKANQVKDKAGVSSQEMVQMTDAMKRISEASVQIGNIIAEIEDIASQTNMLSLNAAIEAARAGEAGKGFAVVADQIRTLAEDSAQSAVNTRRLIESSLSEVENGNQITERTAVSLKQVIEGVNMISEKVEQTSVANTQQAEAMKQIDEGIERISAVVQTNSAAAEETSATSEELSAQAEVVNGLVSKFIFRT